MQQLAGVLKENLSEVTPAQEKYRAKPGRTKPETSDFRKQITAAKKMLDAGASEAQLKAKFPQEVINAVNSEASLDEEQLNENEYQNESNNALEELEKWVREERYHYGNDINAQELLNKIYQLKTKHNG
jgi:hypothetical protein